MVYISRYTMLYKYGKGTRNIFLGLILFLFYFSFQNFGFFFNKTLIPLALVGYEMIIANSPRWLSTISYQTRARGIIVNYPHFDRFQLKSHHRLAPEYYIPRQKVACTVFNTLKRCVTKPTTADRHTSTNPAYSRHIN